MSRPPIIRVREDADALAGFAADWLVERLAEGNGPRAVALGGGSTPKKLYELLAQPAFDQRLPWDDLRWFWGDERMVPVEDSRSNQGMARQALLDPRGIAAERVHGVPTTGAAEGAARAYEADLQRFHGSATLDPARPLFAVTLLGIGPDGHTASLFPGTAALDETERWTAVAPAASTLPPPVDRVTLTYPAIASSAEIVFLVTGAEKRAMVERILAGDKSLPAGRVTGVGRVWWLLDRVAAPEGLEDRG